MKALDIRQFYDGLYCLNHKLTDTCSNKYVLKMLRENLRSTMRLRWQEAECTWGGRYPSTYSVDRAAGSARSQCKWPQARLITPLRKHSKYTCIFFHCNAGFCSTSCSNTQLHSRDIRRLFFSSHWHLFVGTAQKRLSGWNTRWNKNGKFTKQRTQKSFEKGRSIGR